jgi:cell wall assembly regulator SMI1
LGSASHVENELTPAEIIKDAATWAMTDEDGDPSPLKLHPPLSESEIHEFETRLPCPLPAKIRDLLALCRGFESCYGVDILDFTGKECSFEMDWIFPHGLPIAGDGYGNFWVIDLLPESKDWGPIFFACHDAPVILHQSPDLEHFLSELFKLGVPPHTSLVDDVHEDSLFKVWRKNPGVQEQGECLGSSDADIRAFAEQLDPSFQIIDLRDAAVGFGFSWGRYGSGEYDVKRFGEKRIFAYQKKPSLLSRIFGKST